MRNCSPVPPQITTLFVTNTSLFALENGLHVHVDESLKCLEHFGHGHHFQTALVLPVAGEEGENYSSVMRLQLEEKLPSKCLYNAPPVTSLKTLSRSHMLSSSV